ncbi:MAG: hypothetical protein IID58_11170 [Proteobacteria bacterium]|nr:hypothetical protein [Pseudomonadota bacterium]
MHKQLLALAALAVLVGCGAGPETDETSDADADVRAITLDAVTSLDEWLASQAPDDRILRAHFGLARYQIARLRDDSSSIDAIVPVTSPPGSPIGSFTE